jgi:hypothetical protein
MLDGVSDICATRPPSDLRALLTLTRRDEATLTADGRILTVTKLIASQTE